MVPGKKSVFQMVFILSVKKINPRLLDYISEISSHFIFLYETSLL